jgi:hypothetical protein
MSEERDLELRKTSPGGQIQVDGVMPNKQIYEDECSIKSHRKARWKSSIRVLNRYRLIFLYWISRN